MTNSLAIRLGRKIRALRTEAGYSQESFAQVIKLHRTYIGAVERGEKNLTIKNLQKIANALGVDISQLFIEIGE